MDGGDIWWPQVGAQGGPAPAALHALHEWAQTGWGEGWDEALKSTVEGWEMQLGGGAGQDGWDLESDLELGASRPEVLTL